MRCGCEKIPISPRCMTISDIGCDAATVVPHVNYKTKICKYGKNCHYGDRCFFAHSEKEILPRTSRELQSACRTLEGMQTSSRRSSPAHRILRHQSNQYGSESIDSVAGIFDSGNSKPDSKMKFLSVMPNPDQGVFGALLPVLSDISSISSCGVCEDQSGSTTPVSTDHAVETIGCLSYPIACIRYLQSINSPMELEKLLRDAAPLFYTE